MIFKKIQISLPSRLIHTLDAANGVDPSARAQLIQMQGARQLPGTHHHTPTGFQRQEDSSANTDNLTCQQRCFGLLQL